MEAAGQKQAERTESGKATSKKAKPLPHTVEKVVKEKKAAPRLTAVYIRVHAVIKNIDLLGEVLTSKLNFPGGKLTPTETCITTTDHYTFCTLTCDSKADAKKLKNLMLKDRTHFTPLIDCSFEDFCTPEVKRQKAIEAKAVLKSKIENEFDTRAVQAVRQHYQKLEDVQKKIDKVKADLRNLLTAKTNREEIAALEHKHEELLKQKHEFTSTVDMFRQKLGNILEKDTYQEAVNDLRKQFGVECCRLEKALPMYARRQDVVKLIQQHPVSILLAETGSGKSTQVVQYLMEAGLADQGIIVCTQPRKVAAVSLATHVAQEVASNVGREVGYKAGSKVKMSNATKVVYMTDHALLNECLLDPDLNTFSCVVVDEAHERSLYTDLLLAMVKRCVTRRPEMRVIITSATIDPQVFVDFFGECPVMKVSGRTFPVDVVWQDSSSEENDFEKYTDAAVNKAVEIHCNELPGDILVFLTSAVEIQKCCDMFEKKMGNRIDFKCFQLHGQLQADEQQKVFQPLEKNKRKIVFATNCAETSITIDGIKYVIDTGVAKEMRYDAKRNIRSLDVTVISQSSAEQRKGRAGRTAPGICYRLYSQRSFQAMDTLSLPEILKTHLGQALLKLAELGVTPDMYDFVQSPSPDAIAAALETLHQLGALHDGIITDAGRWMARLPFDPKLGLMTMHGRDCELLYDTIVLAALVSAGSGLFYRGSTDEDRKRLDISKLTFCHPGGDSITALQVFKAWHRVDEKQKNKWCVDHSINGKVIRGVRDTVNEVCKLLKKEAKLDIAQLFTEAEGTVDKLRKILFLCNASNLCHYLGRDKAGYFAAHAAKQVHFHPSSAICFLACNPEWVIYDQLLKTSRDFIIGITPVDATWIEDLTKEQRGFDIEQLLQKKLVNVFTQPAGNHTYFSMVGPHYTRLRQLQESCKGQESTVTILEGNQDTGEVMIFCTDTADSVEELKQELRQVVEKAVQEIRTEVREVAIESEESGLRVVLGQGAGISDILMPHETRKVFINRASENATKDEIKEKFERFGEVNYCHQFTDGKIWGFLIFHTVSQAAAAVEGTQEDESNVAQLEHRRPAKHNTDFKAKLSWSRRRGRGFGFVQISPVYMSKALTKGNLYIGGNLVSVKLDRKNENNLYLRNLPSEVTEDLIKRCLLNNLGESENASDIVERVSVPRENVGTTGELEIKQLQAELQGRIEQYVTSCKVQVTIFPPKTEKTAVFTGEARFSDPVEGLTACRQLKASLTIRGVKVSVEPIISGRLRVTKCVYESCKEQLEKVKEEKLVTMGVDMKVCLQKEGNFQIFLKANDIDEIVRARAYLNDIIRGDVLQCSEAPAVAHLLTTAGRHMLKEVEKKTSAYIKVDNRLKTVSIHGSEAARTRVHIHINDYLNEVIQGTGQEVALQGNGRPPGLLKALHDRYGEHLDCLRQTVGLHSIVVDYRRHKLVLRGSSDSVQKARQAVEDMDTALQASGHAKGKEEEDSIECTACFCPIDKGDLYRLEACAHPFCKDCIARQVSIAVKEHQFPVVCCQDGCDIPLAWRDFNNLSRTGNLKIPNLASSALSAYVLSNKDKARFCTTPDCPMVYRITDKAKAEIFQCPKCEVCTCTACHEQAHDGMTCAMLQSSRQEADGVEIWVKKDPKRRKACPGCRNPIEKIAGCNKMHCTACGAIFCWICCKTFPRERECYDHLSQVHGGIFAIEDLLEEY